MLDTIVSNFNVAKAIWFALGAAALFASLTFVPAMIAKARAKHRLRIACRGKLALTFDDGPDPSLTPRLLDLLQKHSARATFYLLGFRAQRSPAVSDLLAQSGHELGCHGQLHLDGWRVGPWRMIRDIRDAYRNMARWLQQDAPFRPAYGKMTTWTWLALRRRGSPVHFWTFDSQDTDPVLPQPERVVERVLEQGGAVVLLHNHDRGADRERYVLEITEQLLIAARRHGLQICTMSELHGSLHPA